MKKKYRGGVIRATKSWRSKNEDEYGHDRYNGHHCKTGVLLPDSHVGSGRLPPVHGYFSNEEAGAILY